MFDDLLPGFLNPRSPWRWVESEIASILQPLGLVRRGHVYLGPTRVPVITRVLIERSRFNAPMLKRFALILRIDVADLEATGFRAGQESHYTPVCNRNVGFLWGEDAHQYTLPNAVPSSELAAELRKHLLGYVAPLIRRCGDVDGLISVVDEENRRLGENFFSCSLAVALARLGRMDESRRYFNESLGDVGVLRQLAQSFGVEL